jgi:hypothetical protein
LLLVGSVTVWRPTRRRGPRRACVDQFNRDVKQLSELVARIDRGNSPSMSINEFLSANYRPSTPRQPLASSTTRSSSRIPAEVTPPYCSA